ncbi:nitroreductase [Chitinophaga skermanii]|uniref:Putative NAD(P)H nitroreductase n=1 Tax=Chitinophaga skermanii TaxID=331697 RepID=A0A327Q785_9BACT|nr:nitroreductase [Chitinophaga skermanii]RAI99824.1 nitroreductase [Chitinophaga skermanii]
MNTVTEQLPVVKEIITTRRTTKPEKMNGQKIANEQVEQLFELANWAPTHAFTEPWYFVVYSNEKVQEFCADHANLYKANATAESFVPGTYDKLLHMGDQASHVILMVAKRGANPKIPFLEEIAATSCAIQNILLGATAMGIASYWGTGGMILKPAMKEYLQLAEEDQVLGVLYLGYSDEPSAFVGTRKRPLSEKVKWM